MLNIRINVGFPIPFQMLVIDSNLKYFLSKLENAKKKAIFSCSKFKQKKNECVWKEGGCLYKKRHLYGDISEQQANNGSLFKRYSKRLYTIAKRISANDF